jgi:hypothetical protein
MRTRSTFTFRAHTSALSTAFACSSHCGVWLCALQVDLPTACPLLYTYDRAAGCVAHEVHGMWGESKLPRRGRFLLPEDVVQQAQKAMREQVGGTAAHTPHPRPACASRTHDAPRLLRHRHTPRLLGTQLRRER